MRDQDNALTTSGEASRQAGAILSRNLARMGSASAAARICLEQAEGAQIQVIEASDGAPAVLLEDGTRLCSMHQPLEEAQRLLEDFDPAENACAVVLGFGAGHHVRLLLERFKGTGVVVVYEPDVDLLRAVLSSVDCSSWFDPDRLIFIVDERERGELLRVFGTIETQLVAGTRIVEHPASRKRLGARSALISTLVTEAVSNARMSMATLLMRSAGTVRNELLNIDHYALGTGIDDLADSAQGQLGVVVSAGPSLQRNIDRLTQPGVRERCVIVAAQTTLRPLLEAGVKPHFVAALDYHHISKRFYEGLRESDVAGTTLVALPQAHPVIADSWPGEIRWCRALVLEKVLGSQGSSFAALPSASTVAHLAYLFARFLGCDPVALIGQDLGFTDGVYYARGTAIDEVWASELNPFNTIATMEWQRIVRHRGMLSRMEDIHGRSILTDDQMLSYLRRFESLFAEDAAQGKTTIDASEGGVRKAHTEVTPLADVLREYATSDVPQFEGTRTNAKGSRRRDVTDRLKEFRSDVLKLSLISKKTEGLLGSLEECLDDADKSSRVFEKIDHRRNEVEKLSEAFAFVDRVNQLGAFKRYVADRRIDLRDSTNAQDRQRDQIQRDLVNVRMLQEASEEASDILASAIELMERGPNQGDRVQTNSGRVAEDTIGVIEGGHRVTGSVAALVPVNPGFGGAGSVRSLREKVAERSVLQRTLERIGTSKRLEKIVLLVPDDCNLGEELDQSSIGLPLEIEHCGESPFGPEHEAVVAARMFADRCWRGGIGGMSVFDEVLAASSMYAILERDELAAAVLCGADWPLVEVLSKGGIDELVDRWRESNGRQSFVFTQAPPGLGACLVSRGLMRNLLPKNRLATIGSMIGYRPERPEHDPIAREGNVPIDPKVRGASVRAVFDSPRCRMRMRRALEPVLAERRRAVASSLNSRDVVDQLEYVRRAGLPAYAPRHTIVELCTGRLGSGACSPHRQGSIQREPMTLRRFSRMLVELGESSDALLTFGGVGDPLQHPDCCEFISMALDAGVRGVHVRTELQCSPELVEKLAKSGAQVISVDINADTRETYRKAMGHDGFHTVLENMQRLIDARRVLVGDGAASIALPWIVPRIQRRIETYDDIESFYERWQRLLGTPVIDPTPPRDPKGEIPPDPLADVSAPSRVMNSELFRRMFVMSDGYVPVTESDPMGRQHVGCIDEESLTELWRRLVGVRRGILREDGPQAFQLRTYLP